MATHHYFTPPGLLALKGILHVQLSQIVQTVSKYYPDAGTVTELWDEEHDNLSNIDRRSDLFAAAVLKELKISFDPELPADEQMMEAAKALGAMSADLIQLVKDVTREALSWKPERIVRNA